MKDKNNPSRRSKAARKSSNGKRKLIIMTLLVLLLIAVAVIIIVFVVLPNLTKDPDATDEILTSNGYESRFNFGQSGYNRAGECIDSGGVMNKKNCTRENMDLYNGEYRIHSYSQDQPLTFEYSGNIIERNPLGILEITKCDDVCVVLGYIETELIYIKSSSLSDDACYSQIFSTPEWFKDEYKMCSSDELNKMNHLAETVSGDIDKLGLSLKDLIRYFEDYLDHSVIPRIEESKENVSKGLSYVEIRKMLENDGYRFVYSKSLNALSISSTTIEKEDFYGYTLYPTMGDTFVLMYDSNGKVTKLMYKNYDNQTSLDGNLPNSGYSAFWIPDSDEFYGATTSEKCMYSIDYPSMESHYDWKCSKEDMDGIDSVSKKFLWSLSNIGITRSELVKFAENYM